jgi:DNA-binding MarR family transcriptional regulator
MHMMTNTMSPDRKDDAEDVHKTIKLSDRDLRAATRLLNLILGTGDDRGKELTRMAQGTGHRDRGVLLERARQTFVNRAQRSRFFSGAMFGEAAWDMLLALYVTEQSGARHTVSGLVNLSGVPPTTALRWLDFLENKEQLVARKPNPVDKRVFLVELTDKGREALDAYFSGTVPTGM